MTATANQSEDQLCGLIFVSLVVKFSDLLLVDQSIVLACRYHSKN